MPARVDAVEHSALVAFHVQREEVDMPDAQPAQLVANSDAPQALGDRTSLFVWDLLRILAHPAAIDAAQRPDPRVCRQRELDLLCAAARTSRQELAASKPLQLIVVDRVRLDTYALPAKTPIVEVGVRDALVMVRRDVQVDPTLRAIVEERVVQDLVLPELRGEAAGRPRACVGVVIGIKRAVQPTRAFCSLLHRLWHMVPQLWV